MFLLHFDVFCDLLLLRNASGHPFVSYNNEANYTESVIIIIIIIIIIIVSVVSVVVIVISKYVNITRKLGPLPTLKGTEIKGIIFHVIFFHGCYPQHSIHQL